MEILLSRLACDGQDLAFTSAVVRSSENLDYPPKANEMVKKVTDLLIIKQMKELGVGFGDDKQRI